MSLTKEQFNKLAKRAAGNYAKKIKLEKPLIKKVNQLFKKVKNEVAKHGAAHLDTHRQELEKILNDHHIKVASQFSSNLRNIIGKPNNNGVVQRKLDANIRGYAAERAHSMSHVIMDTTRNNVDKAVRDAHIEAALAEETASHIEIAETAASQLAERLITRAPIIAMTETQVGAETGKSLELDTMIDLDSIIGEEPVREMIPKKVWIAMLDSHTREAHADADGQEVNVDEPFDVDGEELMFPGDDSLGASDGNIINCRCCHEMVVE